MTKTYWPDKVRLHMNDKADFYGEGKETNEGRCYSYGYYDGWHKLLNILIEDNTVSIEQIKKAVDNGKI
jgi:hypothetical protein